MRTPLKLIIKLKNEFKDTIKYGTLELAVSEKTIEFNQHGNREQCAVVEETPPFKYVEKGDVIWFHHNITTGHRNRLSVGATNDTSNPYCIDRENGLFFVPYAEIDGIGYNCLAYLVKKKESGEIYSLSDFMFGVPNEEHVSEETKAGLWTPKRKEKGFPLEAIIKYGNENLEKTGMRVGDVVGVVQNSDYVMDVEGETAWRFRHNNVAYKRVGDEFTPVMNWVIVEMDKPDEFTESGLEIPEYARKIKRSGKILKAGSKCTESEAGDEIIILSDSSMLRLYDYVFITEEKNLVPHKFIKSIREWQQKGLEEIQS